jgi:alkanesulfonate monooxygenase SsuD/methylene tetrahydromethanopterin reductase-like flavin-dependent oxidoreductase (luciferase family)
MARFGRLPDDCAICTSTTIVLGETQSIAREKAEYLTSLVPLEMVLATNSAMLGADLAGHVEGIRPHADARIATPRFAAHRVYGRHDARELAQLSAPAGC